MEYPALITWRVVGHGDDLRGHAKRSVEAVLGPVAEDSIDERESSGGRFKSVRVRCLVQSEEQRRDIYDRLRASPHVVLVL